MKTASLFIKSSFLKVFFVLIVLVATNLYAGRTVNSVSFNGANSATAYQGKAIQAQVSVTVSPSTGGDYPEWYESIGYKIGNGPWMCADDTDNILNLSWLANGAGYKTRTDTFNIYALGDVGVHDVSFMAYNNEECAPLGIGANSSVFTLENAIVIEKSQSGTEWRRDRIYWADDEDSSAVIECDFTTPGTGGFLNCNGPITRKIAGYSEGGFEYNGNDEVAPTFALGPAFDADGNLISEFRMYAWDWSWRGNSKEGRRDVGWAGAHIMCQGSPVSDCNGNAGGGGIRYLDTSFDKNTRWIRATNLTVPMQNRAGSNQKWEWYGGEVNQKTGELYMNGGWDIYASLNRAGGNYAFNAKVGILNPATNDFKSSGVITPKTLSDALPYDTTVVSDMAIDAEGNFYLVAAQRGSYSKRLWYLIKVIPNRDINKKVINGGVTTSGDNGVDGWEYVKVVSFPNFSTSDAVDHFGLAFLDGKLYLSGQATNCGGYFCVTELNPLFGSATPLGNVRNYGGSAIRDFGSAQMAPIISGNIYIDANNDGVVTETEKKATENTNMSDFELQIFQNGRYLGSTKTSYGGEYSLMLPSRNATFHVRLKQPQLNGANVKQTWASGGRYAWVKPNSPGNNTVEPLCYNDPTLSAKQNAVYNQAGFYPGDEYDYWEVTCNGARTDGIDASANAISSANYLTRVVLETDMAVARANFAVGLPDRSDSPSRFGEVSHFVLKDGNSAIKNSIYLGKSVTIDNQSIFDDNASKDMYDDGILVKDANNASESFRTLQDYVYQNRKEYTFRVTTNSFDNSSEQQVGYLHGWMSLSNSADTVVGDYNQGLKITNEDAKIGNISVGSNSGIPIVANNASYFEFNYTIPDKVIIDKVTGNKSKAFVRFRYVSDNVINLNASNPNRNSTEANTQPWVTEGEVEDYKATYFYVYNPKPLGSFIAVNEKFDGKIGSQITPTDSSNQKLALYTQVADKPFSVKLVYHDKGLILPKFEQSLIGTMDFVEIPERLFNSFTDENVCKGLTALKQGVWTNNNTTVTIHDANIVGLPATKMGTFRITYRYLAATNASESFRHSCSPDVFSVRPATFTVDNPLKMIGGKQNNDTTVEALSDSGGVVTQYNQKANILKLSANESTKPKLVEFTNAEECDISPDIEMGDIGITNAVAFTSGVSNNLTILYANIGVVNATIIDDQWTKEDQKPKSTASTVIDCIKDSGSNIHDSNGKVGCNIELSKNLKFVPKDFDSALSISDFNVAGAFTYISNDMPMTATATTMLTARLEDNSTATNYRKNCYSKDTSYSLEFNGSDVKGWNERSGGLPEERILYFEGQTENVSAEVNSNGGYAEASITEGFFAAGVANPEIPFNFKRQNVAEHPFMVDGSDFLVSKIADEDSVTGKGGLGDADSSAHFYYGRVASRDYSTRERTIIPNDIVYEVYCINSVVCTNDAIEGKVEDYAHLITSTAVDTNDRQWYINAFHNAVDDGKVNLFAVQPNDVTVAPTATTAITTGKDTSGIIVTSNKPLTAGVKMQPDSWLEHDNDFLIEFLGAGGGWAGSGAVNNENTTGRVVDKNTSSDQGSLNRRVEW